MPSIFFCLNQCCVSKCKYIWHVSVNHLHLHNCVNVNHCIYMQYKKNHIHLHLFIAWVYRFIIHLHNGVYFFHHVKVVYI